MRTFKKHEKTKSRFWHSKVTVLVLAVVTLFLGHAAYGMYKKNQEAVTNRNIAIAQEASLQEKNQALSKEVSTLGTTQGLDQSIRERYGFTNDDESLIIIEDNDQADATSSTSTGALSFLKNLFKKAASQ